MTKPIARDRIYRGRVFDGEIIELCVRWYITYRLSYRDFVEMMAERGVQVAHSTILRWSLGTYRNTRNAGTDSPDPSVLPGALTRRIFPFEANGITSIERSTSRARRSTFSCAVTAALRRRKRSFARLWLRISIDGRAK